MDNPKDEKNQKLSWYYKPSIIIIALLCVGPLALPLVWMSPAFKKPHKIFITILVIILTIWLAKVSVDVFNLLMKELEELKSVLSEI